MNFKNLALRFIFEMALTHREAEKEKRRVNAIKLISVWLLYFTPVIHYA